MLPSQWPLVVYPKTKDQFEIVKRILNSPKVSRVVCATDAGREGELIFRYIYESAQCRKPFSRLWISSLTPEAIRKGFAALRLGADYDSLADAARGRSRADWLVGMNARPRLPRHPQKRQGLGERARRIGDLADRPPLCRPGGPRELCPPRRPPVVCPHLL